MVFHQSAPARKYGGALPSISKQVKSGFQLAGLVLASLAMLFVLALGEHRITLGDRRDILIGAAAVLTISVVLFITAKYWARWFFASACFYTVKTVITGFYGRSISVPSISAPQPLVWEMAGILGVMTVLTYRFLKQEPNHLDAAALVGALALVVYSVFISRPILALAIGLLLLAIAFVCSRFQRARP